MAAETGTATPNAPAPAATSAGTEAPSEAHKVFPPFDPTYFPSQILWFAISFAVLYWLMAKVALPQIGGIIASRRGQIAGDIDEAERLKARSEEALAAYDKALAEARANAFRIAESARGEAKAAADESRAATEAKLAKDLAAAEARIGEIKARALADVGAIATEAADAVVRALADVNVARGEVEAAVASALSK